MRLKQLTKCTVMVILYTKRKSIKKTIRFLLMLFPLARTRTQSSKYRWYSSLPHFNFEQIVGRWCYIKSFSGIDISCVFSDDCFSLIICDSEIFLLSFWFWKLLPMTLKSLNATQGLLIFCDYLYRCDFLSLLLWSTTLSFSFLAI